MPVAAASAGPETLLATLISALLRRTRNRASMYASPDTCYRPRKRAKASFSFPQMPRLHHDSPFGPRRHMGSNAEASIQKERLRFALRLYAGGQTP